MIFRSEYTFGDVRAAVPEQCRGCKLLNSWLDAQESEIDAGLIIAAAEQTIAYEANPVVMDPETAAVHASLVASGIDLPMTNRARETADANMRLAVSLSQVTVFGLVMTVSQLGQNCADGACGNFLQPPEF